MVFNGEGSAMTQEPNKDNYCNDCGNKTYDDICPNCHEELYLYENEDLGESLSDHFMEKVSEQRQQTRGNKSI